MQSITILLVEDNLGDQKLFSLALRGSADTRLEITEDGYDALQFLRREGKYTAVPRPDFVVLDINLPRKSGPEVLAEMKRDPALRRLPVAMLTSAAPTDLILEVCKRANLFIVKPDDGAKYFAIVSAIEALCRDVLENPQLTEKFVKETCSLLTDSKGCEAKEPTSLI